MFSVIIGLNHKQNLKKIKKKDVGGASLIPSCNEPYLLTYSNAEGEVDADFFRIGNCVLC